MEYYLIGNYRRAFAEFEREYSQGCLKNATSLADIYARDLINTGERRSDIAARLYIECADHGDMDVLTYLYSLDEKLIDTSIPSATRSSNLVTFWNNCIKCAKCNH